MNLLPGLIRARAPISYVLLGICAGAIATAVPAMATGASPPTADMAVVSLRPSVSHTSHGARVTFTEVIRNNGPETVILDTLPQIIGGTLVDEVCDKGVSPDTPRCEYGFVAPGTSLTTKFVVKVTASSGAHLTVKGGVVSEAPFLDNNPFNQYLTASIPIT